jgi:hypothetical protein
LPAQGHHLCAALGVGAHVGIEVDEAIEVRPESGVAGGREIIHRMAIVRHGSDGHRAGLNEALHPVCNRLIDEVASGFIKTLAFEYGVIPHRCPRAGVADHIDILDDRAAVGRIE